MGGRLIDADKLIELIDDDIASLDKNMSREGYDVCLCTLRMVKQYIKALSTAEPTKHGRWVIESGATIMHCDACGWAFEYYGGLEEEWNNCPHCGAIMDEVENEDNRR